MVKEFSNRSEWALILGASSGLGLATAKKLAKHGLNLCLCYRIRKVDLPKVEHEFEKIKNENSVEVIHYNMDITRFEKRKHILDDLLNKLKDIGKIKTLVHSIAKGNLKPMVSDKFNTLKHDDFQLTIDSMGISLYDWTKSIFDAGLFCEDARIISFTSEGNTKAWKNYAAVSAAKVVLEAITRNIALEFAPHGIKANCIQAGVTDTASLRMIPNYETLKTASIQRNPNQRLTHPKDVADVVYLLVKDEAKWITGTTIQVTGGEHLR